MPSEACLAQLPAGLFKHCEIGSRPLSAIAKLTPPVPGSTDPFHQLHQVAAQIPESTATAEVGSSMGQQTGHHIGGQNISGWFAEDEVVHRCPAQGMGVGRPAHHGSIAGLESLQAVFR